MSPTSESPDHESSSDPRDPHHETRLKRVAPFLAVPLVFLLTVFAFAAIVGPFYYAYNYDPDYVYLLNGLNLAIGQSPEHIDHPGTPLQLLLGLGIRLVNLGVPAPQTAVAVIAHAETYLTVASMGILLAYAATMIWVGVAVAKRTGSMTAGWLVQATPFLLGENFPYLLRVSPEPLLLLVALLLVPFLIQDDEAAGSKPWSRRILLSFLVATGVCIKVTFLPVFTVVLLLERGRTNRAWCAALVVLWSLLWTIPIWSKYGRLFGWFWGLAMKQGPYARGPVGLIGVSSVMSGLGTLVWANRIYALCLCASVVTLAVVRSKSVRDRLALSSRTRLLACLLAGGLVQFLISAKNPQSRYLAPSMGLIGLNVAVIALILERSNWFSNTIERRFVVRLSAGLAVVGLMTEHAVLYGKTRRNAEGRREMSRVTNEQQQGARIFYYGASSPVNALTFATYFAGQQYYRIVEKLVRSGTCQSYLFNSWNGEFYSLRGRVPFEEILRAGEPVRLQGDLLSDAEKRRLPAGVSLRELRRFEDERIYEIRRADTPADGSRP